MDLLSKIEGPAKVGKTAKKSPIKPVRLDTVCLSSEAQKLQNWVQMLHEMPDVRPVQITKIDLSQPLTDRMLG